MEERDGVIRIAARRNACLQSLCPLGGDEQNLLRLRRRDCIALGKPLSASDKDIIAACYKMALKNLKDKDGIYDIRKYFSV